jgi:selenium donor protein
MAPDALAQVLRPLEGMFPAQRFPQVLVGLGPSDDAAVYKITDELALIATLDFFTPVVDDPYQYGAIAATNAFSDIYAMGGRVALALNICCLSECLPLEVIAEILRGGADKIVEAGGVLVGGHSIDDQEPKYGLVALGFAHPDRVLTTAGAQPGDTLVLTKPLGVGIITTAFKADQTRPEHFDASVQSMLKLNRTAAEPGRRTTRPAMPTTSASRPASQRSCSSCSTRRRPPAACSRRSRRSGWKTSKPASGRLARPCGSSARCSKVGASRWSRSAETLVRGGAGPAY